MKKLFSPVIPVAFSCALFCTSLVHGQVADIPDARPVAGIPVNNVEANVHAYTLPPLLKMLNGQPVTDADMWFKQRRPEIVHFYETQVYGRVPATAPKVTWEVADVDRKALGGTAVVKHLIGHMGSPTATTAIHVTLVTPANATKPVPLLLGINFNFGARTPAGPNAKDADKLNQDMLALVEKDDPSTKAIFDKNPSFRLVPAGPTVAPAVAIGVPAGVPVDRLLAAGIGYATFFKDDVETDIEGPTLNPNVNIARKLGLAPGQTKPDADEWGAIAAWAWGISRVEDYLETDKDVDAKRVAITGGSRLGKTVLWAGVNDQRIAMVIACSGGSGGAKISRRNYGEQIAHLVAPTRYPYQFAANYAQFAADPGISPMDTHCLVAAMAPRFLLLHTAANNDNWSDPKGEYLAAIAATPAYELVGEKGLTGRTTDQPMVTGELVGDDLAFYLNNGGHAALNWDIALQYMTKKFHPGQ